ncbi:MAG: C39 family peptidase, partial [Clostridiales bacterium]|nr:C39 family peptidase [Clostridiales bacterium]
SQGINTYKLERAKREKKDPAVYMTEHGRVFYGNPYIGFVGRMDSYKEAGYGVYHGPVAELLDGYMPGMALDLTGCAFDDLLYYLALDIPVWIIINTTYAPLPASAFLTWETAQGPVKITYREHSVLLTGYDGTRVYFNDPLAGRNSALRSAFAAAWEQMGRQAVTVMP